MFTREELEAMRKADEEIEREFEETEDEILEAELRDGNLHAIRNRDKWERKREKNREYYRRNREKRARSQRAYYRSHKEQLATKKKEYYLAHKEEYKHRKQENEKRNRATLPKEITTVFCQFWKENKMSRDTFAKNVGVSIGTARQWGYRRSPPNIKKIRAVYPQLADELERIMEGCTWS